MNDVCTYLIQIQGRVEAEEINAMSPQPLALERADGESTLWNLYSDQSGLIGLLRKLHGQGFVLLSVQRIERV